jgi:2-keto-4-pentenoate hydratase
MEPSLINHKISNLDGAADWVLEQHNNGASYNSLPHSFGITALTDAYKIQELVIKNWETSRGKVSGYKLALTSKPIQKMCGMDHPCIGRVFQSMIKENNSDLKLGDFGRLGVEFELAIRIASDMPRQSEPWTSRSVKENIKSICASFELVDDRNANYSNLDACSLIADNSWSAGAVLAPETRQWGNFNFENTIVTKIVNGVSESSITGAALGSPLNSIAWVANFLNETGSNIKENDIVMTGSTFATFFPKPGDSLTYEVSGLESVQTNIYG